MSLFHKRSPSASRPHLLESRIESVDLRCQGIYTLGGVAALITVLVALLDIAISFLAGERDVEPGSLTATAWFARFRENRFLTLRDLGLWNIVNSLLALPVYLALYGTHRRAKSQPFAALAAILAFIGTAVYAANNKALPMLALNAWAGIAGSGLLLAFTAWVTFVTAEYRRAMVLAMGGGLLSIAWQILTARRLFQLGRAS